MDYITNENVLYKTKGDALKHRLFLFTYYLCIKTDIELLEFTISAIYSACPKHSLPEVYVLTLEQSQLLFQFLFQMLQHFQGYFASLLIQHESDNSVVLETYHH